MTAPTRRERRRARGRLWSLLLLGSVACGDAYPEDWPSKSSTLAGLVGGACPDLRGTWAVRFEREFSQSSIGRSIGPRLPRFNWETMSITGDARDSLIITTQRSDSLMAAAEAWAREHGLPSEYEARKLLQPQVRWAEGAFFAMTDAEYADNLAKLRMPATRQRTLLHGVDYTCEDGWVKGERFLKGWYRDSAGNPRDTVIGVVRVARNDGGDLVFGAEYPEDVQLSLWAGTSGPSLGTWTMHQWSRLRAVPPVEVSPEPRPWAAPFVREYPIGGPTDTRLSVLSPSQVDSMVRPAVARWARVTPATRSGSAFRFELRSPSTDSLARALGALRQTQRFTTVQVARLDGAPGQWTMEVRVQPGLQPSTLPTSALVARVAALLGSAVQIDTVRADDGGAHLYLVCTGRFAWRQAIDALSAARDVRLGTYMFDRLDPGDVSRGWVFVEERRRLYVDETPR